MPFLHLFFNQMDVKSTVNSYIIDELEQGNVPRKKTWNTMQISGSTQKEYRGLNQLILQIMKMRKQFSSNRRLTFKQVQNLGGKVKAGEKATIITYRDKFEKDEEKEDGTMETKKIAFLKPYFVFNLDQTTIRVEEDIPLYKGVSYETAEAIIENFEQKPKFQI